MFDRSITIPAMYVGQSDAELTLETPDAGESAEITLWSVKGEVIAQADDFRAAQIGPSLLEVSDRQLAEMFGAFLAHALADDDAREGWKVLTDDASDWTDALALFEDDDA